MAAQLQAGIASLPVPSPLGIDTVGFLRRFVPVQANRQPLEVTVLLVAGENTRVALVGLDMLGTSEKDALEIRVAVAGAAGCAVDAVFVNSQHTHAAPPPPGLLKLGGLRHELTASELAYWDNLVRSAAAAATLAAERLRPARLGGASTELTGLTVNRRERTGGGTILGWNRDGACDSSVNVLRLEATTGEPIACVVGFACHPVVVGPDVHDASSDFVGPMRAAVRAWTGADCLFLQGCAGNILPLQAFMEAPGAEVDFGRRLAVSAIGAWSDADVQPMTVVRSEYGSAVPIARYRREATGEFGSTVAYAVARVRLPLVPLPSPGDMAGLHAELAAKVTGLQGAGAGPEAWNPIDIHVAWAAQMEQRLRAGDVAGEISGPVTAIRLGDFAIVGLPGEPFNEIGSHIKSRSPAVMTLCCGYTNAALGYLPTSQEYPFGGYEVSVNHRHYGNLAPIAAGCDLILQDASAKLLTELFAPC